MFFEYKISISERMDVFWTRTFFIAAHFLLQYFLRSDASITDRATPPIELRDVGFDGTWKQFCDLEQVDKEFAFYPEHELRTLRYLICDMWFEDKINLESMSPFIVYKYCEMTRFRVDDLLEKLVGRFSNEESKKKEALLAEGTLRNDTECYKTAIVAFEKMCVGEKNPYYRMFTPLLASACNSNWLTLDNILSHMDDVCVGKKISGQIDWQSIVDTVPYRKEATTNS